MRAVPLDGKGEVKTIVGDGLFEFGDVDGVGDEVRLQHALGVACADGKLYVADTYNSKIKVIDPQKRSCTTFLGGEPEGWLGDAAVQRAGRHQHRRRQAVRGRHQRPSHSRGGPEDEGGVHADVARGRAAATASGGRQPPDARCNG